MLLKCERKLCQQRHFGAPETVDSRLTVAFVAMVPV